MAKKFNLTIEQGTTFKLKVVCRDINRNEVSLEGYTARAQVRSNYADFEPNTYAVFTCEIDALTGTINLTLGESQTQLLNFDKGVWDLELVSSENEVDRLLEGVVRISREVTRNS